MLLVLLLVGIPLAVLRGWVLTQLWAWFIVPTFGLPALGIVPAIGLVAIVTYLTAKSPSANVELSWEKVVWAVITSIIVTFFYLGTGWLFSLFM